MTVKRSRFGLLILMLVSAFALTSFSAACRTDDTPIRVGLLPIIDSVPFYAAEADGLFEEAGLNVELVTFSSALERNVALETGAIDGQLADLIATGLINNTEDTVSIVKTTYRATNNVAMIALVAGADSGITSAGDLAGKSVGISTNSLIEYHLDQYLDAAGIDREAVVKTEVASIPQRMELLSQGQLDAAVLPEPLITLAVNAGGHVILDDRQSRLGMSVLEFKVDYLRDHEQLVRRFVEIHEDAVTRINERPENYDHLLPERARLPESLIGIFEVPPFPSSDVPTPQEIQRANDWLIEKGLITTPRDYEVWVDDRFVQDS